MFRIDNSTALSTLPSAPIVGTPGYFTNGNEQLALQATIVDDWWLNQVQEEILAVVAAAGLTPDKNNRHQLLDALNHMYTGVGVIGGYLPLSGGTIYKAATSDPLTIQADAGQTARIIYNVTGQHQWITGAAVGGGYGIMDATIGQYGLRVQPTTPLSVEISHGDLTLGRTDQTLSYITRPTAGQGIVLSLAGGGNLGSIVLNANTTTATGQLVGYSGLFYQAGAHPDPLHLQTDSGNNCLTHYLVSGVHEWGVGTLAAGGFNIYDYTNGTAVLSITTTDAVTVNGSTNINGQFAVSGGASIAGALQAGHNITAVATTGYSGTLTSSNINGHGFGFCSEDTGLDFYGMDANSQPQGTPLVQILGGSGLNLRFGDAYKPVGGVWQTYSDERLKRDIAPYRRGLAEIRRLEPVTFRFNEASGLGPEDRERVNHGLVAQQVAPVMPEMVGEIRLRLHAETDDEESIQTLNTDPMLYAMLNAVKELAERVEALEAK